MAEYFANRFRLLFTNKSIWVYSGFRWSEIFNDGVYLTKECPGWKRREIIKQCTVMVDGRYIDSQRNPSKKWAGSDNQRVLDIQQSLQKGEIVLWKC